MSYSDKKIMVIGGGGREHAICWKLAQSDQVSKIFALPGNFGISQVAKCENLKGINLNDFKAIGTWCEKNNIDVVIVGPEDPLANGLCDVLQKYNVRCFGPTKIGAQIEADKMWAKDFMQRHGIPTARYEAFTDSKKAKHFIKNASYKALVVKAAGLAAGKGVIVAADVDEAIQAIDDILDKKKFGHAGDAVVIEECLEGEEISVLAFVDGKTVAAMLPAQDHKRLLDNDNGPNTGGMGAYCPCPLISEDELDFVKRDVLQKAVDGLQKDGIPYCGVLYAGLMMTSTGPKVLEFNCRFGDPETQVILPLLETDLYDVIRACCESRLHEVPLKWLQNVAAVGVVMASAGYPETSTKGNTIEGIPKNTPKQLVFHSGISLGSNNELLTNGGRVLIVVSLCESLQEAALTATKVCRSIIFKGSCAQFRTDIASKAYNLQKCGPVISLSYKASGVDIDAGDNFVQRIKPLSRGTHRTGVIGGLGGFGGMLRLKELNYKNPVICETVNGVGSKIKLAIEEEMYEIIGYDLIAVCANDLLESGAEPVAFLDYIACGKLQVPVAAQIVKGISEGCRDAKCALLGGETAEMPSIYEVGKYDIAGYCMGIIEEGAELPKFECYEEGDLLIALPSSGLHCVGFETLLQCLYSKNIDLKHIVEIDGLTRSLGQHLVTPSHIYTVDMLQFLKDNVVKSISHITTGLLPDVRRIIPEDFEIKLDFGDLGLPEIFGWITSNLQLSKEMLLGNFNCGIGMVFVVPKTSITWKKCLRNSKVLGVLKRRDSIYAQKSQIEVKNFAESLLKASNKFGDIGTQSFDGVHSCKLQQLFEISTEQRQHAETIVTKIGRHLTRIPKTYKDPVLVMGTDGVGTKIKIAQQIENNSTIGIDLVAMCVNDILCNGAKPWTFSTYYACGQLDAAITKTISKGVLEGVNQACSSMIEYHIAPMPLLYKPPLYDIGGFSLGIAEYGCLLPNVDAIKRGDIVIGLPSSGLHSNGYSLVHKVMELAGVKCSDRAPFSSNSFGEELLRPTKIYVDALVPLIEQGMVKALAHITGGGLIENIPRVLKKNLGVYLDAQNFVIPAIFGWLAAKGNIKATEMLRTYNCGVGMILIVDPSLESQVLDQLQYTERATKIGVVVDRKQPNVPQVTVANFENCLQTVQRTLNASRKRVAVLISGSGTNLQALIDASRDSSQGLNCDITLVISNKADVLGLERAKRANIPTLVLSHKSFTKREDFDEEICRHLKENRIDLVCLAGFMRVLSEKFVKQWKGRLVNIHPSLLPKHPGLHVQKKALEAGDSESGCTVHFVDEGVDTGAIIVQARVPILSNDTEEALTKRIQKAEHFAFPKALRLLANGMVKLDKNGQISYL